MSENAKQKQLNKSRSQSPIHRPYSTLTSGDIKFGYFESSVVPSSISCDVALMKVVPRRQDLDYIFFLMCW